jgi:hypothetical protein
LIDDEPSANGQESHYSPRLLALREGAKLGYDQPLDLVFGLWDFFHKVITEEVAGQTRASRRLFHSLR